MTHRSSLHHSAPLDGDFVFDDDAPTPQEIADVAGPEWPHWVWVLVRSTSDPPMRVWVRYSVETAPEGLWTTAARVPNEGDDGVLVLPRPRIAAVTSVARSAVGMAPFLAHTRAVAATRREHLEGIARGLQRHDHEAVLQHARALVGG